MNQYDFDVYFDDDYGGWFWVIYWNNQSHQISKPFNTEKEAYENLALFQSEVLKGHITMPPYTNQTTAIP